MSAEQNLNLKGTNMIDNLKVPDLGTILAYKSVHLLCTTKVNKDKRLELKVSHYACVLVGGPSPTWALWTVRGIFKRFYGSKTQINQEYPNHTWRRKMATWNILEIKDNDSVKTRRGEIKELLHVNKPVKVEQIEQYYQNKEIATEFDKVAGQEPTPSNQTADIIPFTIEAKAG